MKFQVRLKVSPASGLKQPIRLEIDSNRGFEVSAETLCIPGKHSDKDPSFFLKITDGVLFVASRPEDPGIPLNDKWVKEFPVHPSDRVQMGDYSIEFIEIQKLDRESTQVKFLQRDGEAQPPNAKIMEKSDVARPPRAPRPREEKDFTHSLFSLVNIPVPELPGDGEADATVEPATRTQYDEIPDISKMNSTPKEMPGKEISHEAASPGEIPGVEKKTVILETFRSALPAPSAAPPEAAWRGQAKLESDFEVKQKIFISLSMIMTAAAIIGPRLAPCWVANGSISAFGALFLSCIISTFLSVLFAVFIYFSSSFLEIDKSFSDAMRFSAYTTVAMCVASFGVPDYPVLASIGFMGVVLVAFTQFRAIFHAEERRLAVIFGSYFGIIFLLTYYGSGPYLPKAVAAKPMSSPLATSSQGSVGDVSVEEKENLARGLLEIESDLQKVEAVPVSSVPQTVQVRGQYLAATNPTRSTASSAASTTDTQSGVRSQATSTSSYPGTLLARAPQSRPVDFFAIAQLFTAAKAGNLSVVREMIGRKKVSPNHVTEKSVTPLMVASYSGQTAVVKYLVSEGARVNAQNQEGTTPLMFAVYGGHKETASFLIRNGADKKKKTKNGERALDIAKRAKNGDIVKLLGGKWTEPTPRYAKKKVAERDRQIASKKKPQPKKHSAKNSARKPAAKKTKSKAGKKIKNTVKRVPESE